LGERLVTMHQDVTSRGRLIDLIKKFNLYPKEQAKRPLEDIVEDMRPKIRISALDINPAQQKNLGSAFQISFAYDNRQDSYKVVNEIVGMFTSQNVMDRRAKSRVTTDFLNEEVKVAKAELDRIENALTQFKLKNAGSLPDELQINLGTQRSYESQLQSARDQLSRLQADKLMHETTIQNFKNQLNTLVTTTEVETATQARNDRLMEMEREVQNLETRIAVMRESFRAEHPTMMAAVTRLETAKRERDRLAVLDEKNRQQAAPVTRKILNPNAVARQTELEGQIKTAQARMHAVEMEVAERIRNEKQINESLKTVNARIQANPLMQGEYVRLSRDFNLAKTNYDGLTSKKSSAEVANRLEDRSAGENLEVLDPASVPVKPSEPNRWLIVGGGVGIGLVLGLFFAGAQEVKDTTLKNLKDCRAYTNQMILSSIPLLENALLVRRTRRLRWLAWSSAMIVGVIAMSTSVYYYYWGRGA
ncbi:MAG: GumC family protein, partial [Bryobacteraceae bacterium]